MRERIRVVREALAGVEVLREALEAELRELVEAAGLRPGDGTDQPALFEADEQQKLF